jgi:hypothetical protein
MPRAVTHLIANLLRGKSTRRCSLALAVRETTSNLLRTSRPAASSKVNPLSFAGSD